jgi:integrase
MRYAVFPARLIASSPFPKGFLPKRDKRRAKACFYPDEDAQYLACREIPLVERVLAGLLIREGMRVEELAGAQVRDFDRVRGVFYLDQNKTDDPRCWDLANGSAQALRLYLDYIHPDPRPDQPLLVHGDDVRTSGQRLFSRARSDRFRKNVELAGLRRAQLWANGPERRHLVIHDLRGSFVTIHLALGKSENWISQRTGHRSSDQINKYRRDVDTMMAIHAGELTALHLAIPELAELAAAASPAAEAPAPVKNDGANAPPIFALPPDLYDPPLTEWTMAPAPGLEPGTRRLTAACSTN